VLGGTGFLPDQAAPGSGSVPSSGTAATPPCSCGGVYLVAQIIGAATHA
jgi:hypothetical protein